MSISVSGAAMRLEAKGLLVRDQHDNADLVIDRVREELGQALPADLEDFYRERISSVADFWAVRPTWNDRVGWRPSAVEITSLLPARAAPLFLDGCGSLWGLDLTSQAIPAVYFFDHEDEFAVPSYAAGSSIGAFLMLLAEHDKALREKRPPGWELAIDPDIDKCPRAPPIWLAG